VDLDYKGLGNAGTWFIGRLQTERDKSRVVEGLMGSEAAGGLDRAGLEALISNLSQRTFLMRNVHDDAPMLFRTRWALSYLRGPLTLAEIRRMSAASAGSAGSAATSSAAPATAVAARVAGDGRPVVQHGVAERFLVSGSGEPPHYTARIGARVRARYAHSKAGIDTWQVTYYLAPVDGNGPDWGKAEAIADPGPQLVAQPAEGASFAEAPAAVLSARDHKRWAGALEDHVYRNVAMELPSAPTLRITAAPGMTEGEFRSRVALALREKRDAAVEALRRKYAARLDALGDRERKAAQKVERERSQASNQTLNTALSVGGSLLGVLFGGRRSTSRKVSTAARSVGRASKERTDVAHAEADVEAVREQITSINQELEAEVARLESEFDPQAIVVERTAVRPRKADIAVEDLALVWCP
jgi:hypothetical protein